MPPEAEQSSTASNGSVHDLHDRTIVQIAKTSGCAFLNHADRIWNDRQIMLIGPNGRLGIEPTNTLDPAAGGGWWDGGFVGDDSDVLAQISSTSGTTGEPKAIGISRRAVSDTVDRLVRHMELDDTIREYVGVPVTFSFGLGRARAVAAAGGAVFLPQNGFRPDEIADMLRSQSINALSAVPTMLRVILANPELLGGVGKHLRWLEIGSQFMAAEEKKAVRALFPNAIILQHYGL
ncbi:MAG: AMP-binding protein, partial [Pontixanthobacter sp.]